MELVSCDSDYILFICLFELFPTFSCLTGSFFLSAFLSLKIFMTLWLHVCLPVLLLICRTNKCVLACDCGCVCESVCAAEWICMRASGVTLLSHAKASVEQIGLVGCRDSTHISLNKSALQQSCVCVCVRERERVSKQPGMHLVRKALRGFV